MIAQRRTRILCWGLLVLSGILFGGNFSLIKISVAEGAHPLGLAFWFVTLTAGFFCVAAALRGSFRHWTGGLVKSGLLLGLLSVAIPSPVFFFAAERIDAGIMALAVSLVPIVTYLGALLIGDDQPNRWRVCGIILGAVGVAMIVVPGTSLPDPGDSLWAGLVFIAAVCFALEHLVFARVAPLGTPLDLLLFAVFAGASILLLPMVLFLSALEVPQLPLRSFEWAIIGIAVVTALDYLIFAVMIALAGPVFTSQTAYAVTIAGILWGIILFDERHSPWIWGALAVLMIGVYLVRPNPRRDPSDGLASSD